jgi:hypothetical protein
MRGTNGEFFFTGKFLQKQMLIDTASLLYTTIYDETLDLIPSASREQTAKYLSERNVFRTNFIVKIKR